ncbi:MAG: hypothetical protein ACPHL6_11230 [Rubripirellula sp.]
MFLQFASRLFETQLTGDILYRSRSVIGVIEAISLISQDSRLLHHVLHESSLATG